MGRSLQEIATALTATGVAHEVLLAVAIVHGFELLADEVRSVAHGDEAGPGGLEALTVGVAGSGLRDSVTKAMRAHGASMQSCADALRAIADLLAAKETP